MEIGLVDEADYKFLLSEIKLNMDEWLEHYDDEHGRQITQSSKGPPSLGLTSELWNT